jgi:hypothetical protein
LNAGARQLGGNDIQSLQVGGLSVEPGRGWVVSFSGGIDSTRAAGTRRVVASGQAGISKTSRRTTVALAYHRGLFTVFPAAQVSYGDTANIHFVQSFSRRINLHADSSYIRSSALTTSALTPSYVMNTVYGSTGLDVVIEKNLVFSSNFFLVSQNLGNASFPGSNLHRRTATIGINYYLPAVGSERNR